MSFPLQIVDPALVNGWARLFVNVFVSAFVKEA
jgi:hypothetical protein